MAKPLVKFRFLDPRDEAKVFMELVAVTKVITLKEENTSVHIMPLESLKLLKRAEVEYEVLEELETYDALQALRSATTGQVQ